MNLIYSPSKRNEKGTQIIRLKDRNQRLRHSSDDYELTITVWELNDMREN